MPLRPLGVQAMDDVLEEAVGRRQRIPSSGVPPDLRATPGRTHVATSIRHPASTVHAG